MQYFNAIFIVIATSRPLNKKNTFAVSPRIQQLLRICVRKRTRPQTAHFCCAFSDIDQWPVVYGTLACHCWQTSHGHSTRMPESIRMIKHLWRFTSFFVVHFVAKRYILQQKCLKGQIGTLYAGNTLVQLLAAYTNLRVRNQNAQRHRQTVRQTDR